MGSLQQMLIAEASGENAKTTAWVAAVIAAGGTVSAGRRTLVNTLLNGLDSNSLTTKLYRLWLHAAENSQSALIDIINLGAATAVSSPTFTTDRGYTTSRPAGVPHYVDLGTPGASPYTLNSAHFGFWLRTNLSIEDGVEMGSSTASVDFVSNLAVAWSDGNTYAANNDNNSDAGRVKPTNTSGHWIVNRSGSTTVQIYQGGSSFGTSGVTSAAVPTQNFVIGGAFDHLGVNTQALATQTPEFAASHIGGSLSGTDATNLFNLLQTYMTAVGA